MTMIRLVYLKSQNLRPNHPYKGDALAVKAVLAPFVNYLRQLRLQLNLNEVLAGSSSCSLKVLTLARNGFIPSLSCTSLY